MAPRIEDFEPKIIERKPTNLVNDAQNPVQAQNANARESIANEIQAKKEDPNEVYLPIRWRNVVVFTLLHIGALYGIYCCFYAKYQTLIFTYLMHSWGGLGITAGAHRLWAHRTYKAKLPLRIFLGIGQTVAVQNSIFEWCRDHRVHHKHAETNADPHNAKRGFFFSHMGLLIFIGWLLMKKHPLVAEKGKRIPLDDLLADPVVFWQKKYYKPLAIFFCFIMPTIVPAIFWNESLVIAYFVPAVFRYILTLHTTWLVNSVAHMWGYKPYDKNINPVENMFVALGAIGEGFHNYHHTFPQDYATSELGSFVFNFTKVFIDVMAFFGLAYDRNKISKEVVLKRRMRTGDLAAEIEHHDVNYEHDY